LPGANTLAYYGHSQIMDTKSWALVSILLNFLTAVIYSYL
jgi:hypothetical protein